MAVQTVPSRTNGTPLPNINERPYHEPDHLLALARDQYDAWKAREEERRRQEEEERRQEALREARKQWQERLKAITEEAFDVEATLETVEGILRQVQTLWETVPKEEKEEPSIELLFQLEQERLQDRREQLIRERHLESYAHHLARWWKETVLPMKDALEQEKERLEKRDVTLYRVHYGVVAEDEDGEKFVETRTFYTWASHPDQDGFWTTVAGIRLRPTHVVMVEEIPTTVGGLRWILPYREGYLEFEWYAYITSGFDDPEYPYGLRAEVDITLLSHEQAELERLKRMYPRPQKPKPPFPLDWTSWESRILVDKVIALLKEQEDA